MLSQSWLINANETDKTLSPYFKVIGVYFGTDKTNLDKSLQLVYKELDKVKTQKLGKLQLHKAKKQLMEFFKNGKNSVIIY